ncbi:hypothetical protein V498_05810 [Pseudogymnoascus sp. VKM F-4517 (FW-2822)]|nr:hypothetical protein V498_05810 [Pseudogymnoascus sp. VKM F-4517 (FW-2822)]
MASLSRQRKLYASVQTEVAEEPAVTQLTEKFEYFRPTLLSYDELPEWQKDSPFILYGYRPESNSAHACFASWLYLHNETVNIYSHLLPGVVFLAGEVMIYQYFDARYPMATVSDRLIFSFFLLTAVTCLGLSAMFHTFLSHSAHVSHIWLQLDFVGIIVLTLGEFVSAIYVGFYCDPGLQRVYWTMIITLCSASIFILLNPRFQGSRWRTFRVCTFVCTGLSGFLPIAHGVKILGFSQMLKQSGMPYYLGEGLLLMLGTLFYTVSTEIETQKCDMRKILIDDPRCGFQRLSNQAGLISSDAHTRFSMFWSSLQQWFI